MKVSRAGVNSSAGILAPGYVLETELNSHAPLLYAGEGGKSHHLPQSPGRTPLLDAFLKTHHAGKSDIRFNRYAVAPL